MDRQPKSPNKQPISFGNSKYTSPTILHHTGFQDQPSSIPFGIDQSTYEVQSASLSQQPFYT